MPHFASRSSSTDNYQLQTLNQRTSLSSPTTPMPKLEDEPVASGSSLTAGPRRANGGSYHGKGKKRVSDEGMDEEEGLLSGLRADAFKGDTVRDDEHVRCTSSCERLPVG